MSAASTRFRLWWWVGGGVAGLVLLAESVHRFAGHGGPAPPSAPPRPMPQLVVTPLEKHTDVGEQAMLYDPKPLFLPTEWNTYERPIPVEMLHRPGEGFRAFEPNLFFGQSELPLPATLGQATPRTPLDLLKNPPHQPFIGFGREDIPVAPVTARGGYVEVKEMGTGKRAIPPQSLGEEASPPADHLRDWQPVEFLVVVNATGLVGRPVVTASSQVEKVDAFFRDYLAKSLHLAERLEPGFYQVVVGP